MQIRCERIVAPDLLGLAAANPKRYIGLLESSSSAGVGTSAGSAWDFLCVSSEQAELDLQLCVQPDCPDFPQRASEFLAELDLRCAAVSSAVSEKHSATADLQIPFQCGWLVYFSYELAHAFEPSVRSTARGHRPSPARQLEQSLEDPVAVAMRVPVLIAVRKSPQAGSDGHATLDSKEAFLLWETEFSVLAEAVQLDLTTQQPCPAPRAAAVQVEEDDPARFISGVTRIKEYLLAGDVFQVNLSRAWRLHHAESLSAAQLYANLRAANPAPFSALMQLPEFNLLSSSPERLLQKQDQWLQTRPIAGTKARFNGAELNSQERARFVGDLKERAEHIMLIDLERNDLGRVCEPGSVEVDEILQIESYAHVHHLVSNVRGKVRAATPLSELLRASFPGGTITGCPKVRCMQIIAELEATPRGAYTGSIGYVGHNGDFDLNILIRTITHRDRASTLRAGAGIVMDSQADKELLETRAKARGMLRAFGLAD